MSSDNATAVVGGAFILGLIVGIIVSLGVIEVEVPDCARFSEAVDWRHMNILLDRAEVGLERLNERIISYDKN
ncbi:hypothetical protein LCGC14_0389400 [marine sediment metagenome]|uniref:Uncharacterized protein n=1 Tax=marine sediment metagenome TaxID=412755 RepID=A0A0F9W8X9_9ZZZZ